MRRKTILPLFCALLVVAALAGLSLAQSGGSYDVAWQVIGTAGDQFVAGQDYQMGFTVGLDQEPLVSSGGGYQIIQGYWQDGGTPTAVKLVDFGAKARGASLAIYWETATEIDNLGFHLYRSDTGAPNTFARLNEGLIPSKSPGSGSGAYYEWVDATAVCGQRYYYLLEDVDLDGRTAAHGPVEGRGPCAAVFLPRVTRGP